MSKLAMPLCDDTVEVQSYQVCGGCFTLQTCQLCNACGKVICVTCSVILHDNTYCLDCVEDLTNQNIDT